MTNLSVNREYTAAAVKEGTSQLGRWECITVRDEKGQNMVAVFVNNIPSNVRENTRFRIDGITGISSGRRQVGENWVQSVKVYADVSPVQ